MEGDCRFITKDWLLTELERNGVYSEGAVTGIEDFKVGPGCDSLEGYTCAIFSCSAKITDTSGTLKQWDLIVKCPTTDPVMKEELERTGMHDREIYWYKGITPLLESLPMLEPLPIPKLLGFSNDHEKAMIFEDLRTQQLVKIPWSRGLRGESLRKCVESMAHVHGMPIALKLKRGCSLEEMFPRVAPNGSLRAQYIEFMYIPRGWKLFEEFLDSSRLMDLGVDVSAVKAAAENMKKLNTFSFASWRQEGWAKLLTLCHMDVYNQNLFFKLRGDSIWDDDERRVEKCIIFDWQLAEINLPQDDLALMLLFNTEVDDDELYELLEHYWTALSKHLMQAEVDISAEVGFGAQDFKEGFFEAMIRMMGIWVGCLVNMICEGRPRCMLERAVHWFLFFGKLKIPHAAQSGC